MHAADDLFIPEEADKAIAQAIALQWNEVNQPLF
jgi:hypothetical protein